LENVVAFLGGCANVVPENQDHSSPAEPGPPLSTRSQVARASRPALPDKKTVEQFTDKGSFLAWLEAHHVDHPGIWMKISKKGASVATVSYADAVDAALAFGWVDSQKGSLDEEYYLQAFTQRRKGSLWSKRNVERASLMIADGSMRPAGLAEVDAAKADGRWERAYAGSRGSEPPADFLAALDRNTKAKKFYATLNAANRYALYFRIQTARREDTRAKRIASFIEMLARGETFH
jgi:uncharacterized protein YdeI (YjbR/CyaY-like superfamily)